MSYKMKKPRRGRLLSPADLADLKRILTVVRILGAALVISESGCVSVRDDRTWHSVSKAAARLYARLYEARR